MAGCAGLSIFAIGFRLTDEVIVVAILWVSNCEFSRRIWG